MQEAARKRLARCLMVLASRLYAYGFKATRLAEKVRPKARK